jgi:hypothetical protein
MKEGWTRTNETGDGVWAQSLLDARRHLCWYTVVTLLVHRCYTSPEMAKYICSVCSRQSRQSEQRIRVCALTSPRTLCSCASASARTSAFEKSSLSKTTNATGVQPLMWSGPPTYIVCEKLDIFVLWSEHSFVEKHNHIEYAGFVNRVLPVIWQGPPTFKVGILVLETSLMWIFCVTMWGFFLFWMGENTCKPGRRKGIGLGERSVPLRNFQEQGITKGE